MQFSRIFKILVSLLFIFSSCILGSCTYEKLGLSLDSEELTSGNSLENAMEQADIDTEQYFYEMRSQQKDKNPLKNINIRKAIFYAIDRQRIAQELLGSYGNVLNSLFSQDSIYFSPVWSEYSYNLEKAKEYLKLAGYDKDNPLYLTIGASTDSPSRKLVEDIIRENLEEIGIILWISNKEPKDWYVDCVKNGNYELGIWSIFTPDCESLTSYFSSEKIPPLETDENRGCNNFYWYKNEDFDSTLKKLCNEDTGNSKKELANQLQKILADDAIILPLYSRIFSVAFSKKIQNIEINTLNGNFLENIEEVTINKEFEAKGKTKSENKTEDKESEENENIDSIVVGFAQEPYVLNPFISDNVYRDYINSLVVKGLWKVGKDGEYEPVLVEEIITGQEDLNLKMDLSKTLKVQIKLKDNIYWEDGSPITAYDVVSTILSVQADETLNYTAVNYKNIKTIEALSDKEFLVTFNEFDSKWKGLFSVVLPESIIKGDKLTNLFGDNIFGSGPYKLKEWVKGQYILLESNPYYFGEKPEIEAIKFVFNSDINYLIGKLSEGNLDILSIPADLKLMEDIEKNENLDLLVKPGKFWEHLAICLKPREG